MDLHGGDRALFIVNFRNAVCKEAEESNRSEQLGTLTIFVNVRAIPGC